MQIGSRYRLCSESNVACLYVLKNNTMNPLQLTAIRFCLRIFSLLLVLCVGGRTSAQWERVSGVGGSNYQCIAIGGGNIYVGTDGGVIVSSDGGATWLLRNNGLSRPNISAIAVSGTTILASNNGDSTFRSTNEGRDWVGTSLQWPIVTLDVTHIGTFAIGFDGGLFRTNDDGITWKQIGNGLPYRTLPTGIVATPGILMLVNDSGVYVSSDSGWTFSHPPSTPGNTPTQNLGLCLTKTGVCIATQTGAFVSTDDGSFWQRIGPTRVLPVCAVASNDKAIVIATAGQHPSTLWATSNGGVVWSTVQPFPSGFVVTAIVSDAGNFYALCSSGRLYRSTDEGLSWSSLHVSFSSRPIRTAVSIGTEFFVGEDYGLYRTSDNGTHWTSSDSACLSTCGFALAYRADANNNGLLFAGDIAGISMSADHGRYWKHLRDGDTPLLALSGNKLFAGTVAGLFASTDSGSTWNKLTNGILKGGNTDNIIGLAANDTRVFVGNLYSAFQSTDEGESWSEFAIHGLSGMATVGTRLYLEWAPRDGLAVSTDSGSTWKSADSNKMLKGTSAIVASGSSLFVGSYRHGVHFSRDQGKTWLDFGLPLDTTNVLAIHGDYLYAGTNQGVCRRALADTALLSSTVSQHTATNPTILAYPNPFSGSVRVVFTSLDEHAIVSVENLLGVEVARLCDGELGAGEHSFTWDAHGMPPGMYVCVVRSSRGEEHVPMVVVR